MDRRSYTGLGIMIFGIALLLVGVALGLMGLLALGIYALILIAVGIIIMINKKEDKIEEINYSKVKGGLKK